MHCVLIKLTDGTLKSVYLLRLQITHHKVKTDFMAQQRLLQSFTVHFNHINEMCHFTSQDLQESLGAVPEHQEDAGQLCNMVTSLSKPNRKSAV